MIELKKYKLKDLCLKITDGSHFSPKAQDSGYPMFSVKDMGDYGFIYDDAKHISQEDFEKMKSSGCVPEKDDVLIAKDGSYLTRVFVCQESKEEAVLSSIAIFKCNKDLIEPYFLALLFQTPYVHNFAARSCVSGSALPRIILKAFSELELQVPPLEIQRKIIDQIKPIDCKIAINRKINATLEKVAKKLYDYWFVQFDFPNAEGKPYKSSGGRMVYNKILKRNIPEGWTVRCLGDTFEHNRGISYNTQTITGEGIPMINLASFNVDGTYKPEGLKSYNGEYSNEKILKPYDLVMCNTQQTAIDYSKDIIGKAFLVPDLTDGDIVSSHHVTTIIPYNNDYKAFYCYLFNTVYFHKYAASCSSGTNIMGLDFSGITRYMSELPPEELLSKFSKFIIDIQRRKSIIIKENCKLASLRGLLLPLLMNGQIKFSVQ